MPLKTLLWSLKFDANTGVAGDAAPYGAHPSVAVQSNATFVSLHETPIQKKVPGPKNTEPKTTCFTPAVAALTLPRLARSAPGALSVPSSK